MAVKCRHAPGYLSDGRAGGRTRPAAPRPAPAAPARAAAERRGRVCASHASRHQRRRTRSRPHEHRVRRGRGAGAKCPARVAECLLFVLCVNLLKKEAAFAVRGHRGPKCSMPNCLVVSGTSVLKKPLNPCERSELPAVNPLHGVTQLTGSRGDSTVIKEIESSSTGAGPPGRREYCCIASTIYIATG
ncbi:uncharacterized protein [Battus philenor]|uniref:uncharacterized protein n=1 Tax=Battus philenor TaxID=42288 RepID=UPI0035CEC8A2